MFELEEIVCEETKQGEETSLLLIPTTPRRKKTTPDSHASS